MSQYEEAGRRPRVGQYVRVINVHSDSFNMTGIVESYDVERGLVNVRINRKLIGFKPDSLEV